MAPGLESSILMTNTIPTALSPQESNQSGHYDVSHHLPLVLMFLNKTSVDYHVVPPGAVSSSSDEHDDWADDNSRQPTTESNVSGSDSPIKDQIDAAPSTEASTSTTSTQRPPTQRPNRPKPGAKRPRPKPKTTTTSTTTTTEATTTQMAMSEPSEADVTEQHANNVLQFLVSNPPAWVLEELMNSNASLTTWYPLPIPGKDSTVIFYDCSSSCDVMFKITKCHEEVVNETLKRSTVCLPTTSSTLCFDDFDSCRIQNHFLRRQMRRSRDPSSGNR